MSDRIFGHIRGIPPGSQFTSRKKLSESGIHPPTQAGISGSQYEGADSIVLSGGYEDDEDHGDWIIYTGHGGRDSITKEQIADQKLTRQNKALAISCIHGYPVRVIRGYGSESEFAPENGYRYDGLYRIEDYWREIGKSGYIVFQYLLESIDSETTYFARDYVSSRIPERINVTTSRVVRDTDQSRMVKKLYDYKCQVCDTQLVGSAGPYAEAAHIKPLGRPHNGPDEKDNLLCLCPNHHVLLDRGGLSIENDLTLIGIQGKLYVKENHEINRDYLAYHREHFFG